MTMAYESWLVAYVPTRGRVFVDVGANNGVWTRWLAPNYERVHAIEPNPEVVKRLKLDLPDNVTVHEVAAWGSNQLLEFNLYKADGHSSAYFTDEGIETGKPLSKRRFPAKPLSRIIPRLLPIDLIKIDTEGAECEVLAGAEPILATDRPKLIIEVHAQENEIKLYPWLAERGYSLEVVRNPNFGEGSKMWRSHCWLIASP